MTSAPLTERASDDPGQDSDYDGARKEALRRFFRVILARYFPAVASAIDWEHPPECLEIQTHYEEDFPGRLALYNSGLFWIFKQRVVTLAVLADLREGWLPDEDRFQLAVGWDSVPTQSAGRSQDPVGTESQPTWLEHCRTRFPVCKLIDRLRTDWQDDHSLPVQLARAQIAALRTAATRRGDTEPNGNWCATCTKSDTMRNRSARCSD